MNLRNSVIIVMEYIKSEIHELILLKKQKLI